MEGRTHATVLSRLGVGVLVATAYVLLAHIGYAFYFPGSDVATFWPSSGLLLAALVRTNLRTWLAIIPCVAIAHGVQGVVDHDLPVAVAISFVASDVFESVCGASLLRRLFGQDLRFDRLDQVVGLALVMGLVATPLSALGGAAASHFGLGNNAYLLLYRTWWFGDALGCLVVAPALLTLPAPASLRDVTRARWVEAAGLSAASLAIAQWSLGGSWVGRGELGFPYLLLPLLIWAAIRFGTRGASLFTLVTAGIAIWNARSGRGPFINVGTTAYDHAISLQSFIAVAYSAQLVAALNLENSRALTELRASTAQYLSLARAAPIGIFRTDARGGIVYVNERFSEMTGLGADECRGRTFESVVHPEDRGELPALETLVEPSFLHEDVRVVSREGRARWVLGAFVPEEDPSGARVGYVGTLADVTDRRRDADERAALEVQLRQAQKMEAVGRLAGGVAHDFNNLLTAILGYGHVVSERLAEETSPLLPYVEQMTLAGRRAAALTHQLLAFSRKQVLEPRVIDVNGVVVETVDMLRRLIGEQIVLKTELSREMRPTKVDPNQLVQVLVNLVVNARDAMEADPGTLTIETRTTMEGPDRARMHEPLEPAVFGYVVLSVVDTGHGMDEETQRHLFEPFFTTKADKGTGLGLATVYGIVRQSGGAITCSSHPGIGTRFEVYLPCVDEAAPKARSIAPGPELRRRARDETVLVVEDDDDVRSLVRHVLETSGYHVLAARDADEAERLARRFDGPIALLVTDVVMPRVAGPELARRLRMNRPYLPVLYVSGYSDHPSLHRGELGDHEQFLAKPFTPADLLTHVDRGVAYGETGSAAP